MSVPERRQVRDLVFDVFAAEGRSPSLAELARLTDTTPDHIAEVLTGLAEDHALVLTPDGDAVRMAHPFSAAPMAFVVTPENGRDGRRWWGGCAWDSFGISAALDLDVRVATTCPYCGSHLNFGAGPHRRPPEGLAVWFPRPAGQWWNDVVGTCTLIRMFCNEDHAKRWADDNAAGQGRVVDAVTVWKLAQPWYGDRLAPNFTPHTREHNQRLLEDLGLTGDFWRLP